MIETLELRQLLSANAPQLDPRALFDSSSFSQSTGAIPTTFASGSSLTGSPAIVPLAAPVTQPIAQAAATTDSLMAQTPLPLTQTFTLHSNSGAANVIYLDFDGFTARNTTWNAQSGLPNIITPAFDLDSDPSTFSDLEKTTIQSIWERISEDFRPFDVDVTTEDPGTAAIAASGIRVVVGGSKADWAMPLLGTTEDHLVRNNSFGSADPIYVFSVDLKTNPTPDIAIAESSSHAVGTSLGLGPMGYYTIEANMATPPVPPFILKDHKYYLGEGTGTVSWAPIMGQEPGPYDKALTQWSKGEYFQSDNIEDELQLLSNKLGYRADDHGDTTAAADPLTIVGGTASSDINQVADEGMIGKTGDVDMFSFSIDGFGGAVSLDISPLVNGANLDVLAQVLNASGSVIASSNPVDDILAGSQTYDAMTQTGGWTLADGTFTDTLYLNAGTYYLSVQGTGRPGLVVNPDPTMADSGYSNYGSLGYYSIKGTIGKGLVVGVDFDIDGGDSPKNWNQYTGGGATQLSNLINEAGAHVPYTLSIASSGNSITTAASPNGITSVDVPAHGIPLDALDGYISAPTDTLTFTWGNLVPATVYQIFVFGHSSVESENSVIVTGGEWNGTQQSFAFKQFLSPDEMVVNNNAPGSGDLSTFALYVISDTNGNITITVNGADGKPAGIAGLAINTTKVGSLAGQKFNDANGNQSKDSSEGGLAGWVIYLDQNNDGQLNSTSDQNIVVPAPHVPQPIVDATSTGGATTKNQLQYEDAGSVLDLTVTIDITHTYDADLRVWLVSPTGTRVRLFKNIGSFHDNFTNTTFDDAASVSIDAAAAPYSGTFRPEEALSTFNGENAQGTWTLEVEDDSTGDVGVLNSWSITVKSAGIFLEPYAITDANGDYSFTKLPPGQYFVREHFSDDQKAAGWTQSFAPSPVTVRSGAAVTGVDFGNWIPVAQEGSISGNIFNDLDADGVKDDNEPGLNGWIAYIDANGNGVRDQATTPTNIASTDVPKPILDFSTVNSQVQYNGFGTVFKISVTLDITHSFVGDLDAFLISPTGRQVELFTGVGGQYNNFQNLTLDDDASRSIADIGFADVPYTGTWQPEGLLSDFIGDDAAGTWTLQIRDTQQFDQGTLNSWSLHITAGEVYRTTDDEGNYEFDNVPPGTYVVREEPQPGSTQITPATTEIPAATWLNGRWTVVVVGIDNINDPDGPDSHRLVKNVNFANQLLQPLPGDFDHSGRVDSGDYSIWRKTLGQHVSSPFAGADGNGNGVIDAGDYSIWRSNFGQYIDDFGNNSVTANHIASIPVSKHGAIEVAGDVDWFAFSATQGTTYDLSTTLGTLTDTSLRLIGPDGTTQLAQNDNATGLASLIHWTAPGDGTYFVEVRGVGALAGTYTLGIQTSNDDHGDFAGDATPIAVPSSTPGDIEIGLDHDWFKFNALAGATYSIDVVLGTLVDSQLALRDTDGVTEITHNDDGGPGYGFASHISWTFATAGTYYVDVNGYGTDIGTYHVTISKTSPGAGAGSLVGTGSGSVLSSVSGPLSLASNASRSTTNSGTTVLQPALLPALAGSNSEAALLAWIASQPHSGAAASADAETALDAATIVESGDVADGVDSVFDHIGADTFAESLAV